MKLKTFYHSVDIEVSLTSLMIDSQRVGQTGVKTQGDRKE